MPNDSGTRLARKLGIAEGSRVALRGEPSWFRAALPEGAEVTADVDGAVDVLVTFFTGTGELADSIDALAHAIFPTGSLWVAWPKRSSGVETDLTDDTVRQLALPLGIVDNKVCAIDDTWTALRLVWRRHRR